ncbi:disks large-associated protein 2 isoform X2 [Hyperolius riggenbachi]|uniref:disks large-associated protein 2 isoform X2 n=1 Tax=Hyperolius riggenbachi TaxID=752182 RepID=UPI0035A28415
MDRKLSWRKKSEGKSTEGRKLVIVQSQLTQEKDQQQYSWSPTQHFNEEKYSPGLRNMKGLSGSRNQSQLCSGHTCGLASPEDCEHVHDLGHHGQESRQSYLLSPTESCQMDHHRCSPRSSIHSECMMMPVMMSDHLSSSTFPRMHYSSHYETRDDCAVSHTSSSKINRIPANLLDQFEKQLPLHRDGFHTLQYQKTSTAAEQRTESPGRIRHLVNSVQKLFTKSHSLEGSSKGNVNGTKGDSRNEDQHHGHYSKHSKRSKSKERKSESTKHKSGMTGWWSSDDNLDSDSNFRTPSLMNRHHVDHISHCYPESLQGHFGDLSLKTSKSNNDMKCSACEGLSMTPEGKFMKRSSWSTLTVSQAKEAYRKSSLNLDKPLVHQEIKSSLRPCHYLQVPQDDWGGYPSGSKDEEIPCRRMRSGSYIKAMEEDSGDSDTSPKTSPKMSARPEPLLKSLVQRSHGEVQNQSYLQAASEMSAGLVLDPSGNYNSPKFRSRNQSYMRAVSTLSQASCVSQMSETEINGQYESVCESVFSEVDSHAMDALDLPGCFRTRSHSYLRAIQAGYSQDDDCVPPMTSSNATPTTRSTTAVSYPNYKKTPPPVPPRTTSTSKPLISVTAQSSTESTQDAYHDSRTQRMSPWPLDGRGLYNSTDSLDSNKAMNLALESAAAQRHTSESKSSSVRSTSDKAVHVSRTDEFLKKRRASIGIQVEAADSDTETKAREFCSVGIQVEDEKRQGRFKRSNSVTAAVQADLELEGFPSHITMEDKGLQFGSSFQRHSEPSTPTQYGAVRTVRTQGLFSYREDYRTPVDTSNLPPPDPWLVEPSHDVIDSGRISPSRQDGTWFMKLLHAETKRMEDWCKDMEREAEENDLSEENLGKIRSAVGSAQLLMSQKFQQFYWLCQQNLDPSAMPRPTSQDLAGFWDLLQLSIEDVSMKFDKLHQLKANDWIAIDSPEKKLLDDKKPPPPIPKKPSRGKFPITRERSLDLPDRQRQEARRRLMAAKRAASFRQNSASERADSIEIYIPEAQTRL